MRASWTLLMSLWLAQHATLVAAEDGKRLKTPLRGSFLSLGAGMGSIATSDSDDDSGIAIAARLGQSLSSDIHLVEQVVIKVGSVNREVATSYSFLAAGVRWTPFHGAWELDPGPLRVSRFVDPSALYLEVAAGLGLRERTSYDGTLRDTNAYGPAARFTAGYLPLQGYDYAFGMELDCMLARYEGTLVATSNMLLVVHVRH